MPCAAGRRLPIDDAIELHVHAVKLDVDDAAAAHPHPTPGC